jgi:hypothetical protein
MFNKTGNNTLFSSLLPLGDLMCTYILYIHMHMESKKQDGSSGKASEFYLGGAQFKTWLTRRRIFVVFLRSLWEIRRYFLKLSHDRFITQFPHLLSSCKLTIPQSNTWYWWDHAITSHIRNIWGVTLCMWSTSMQYCLYRYIPINAKESFIVWEIFLTKYANFGLETWQNCMEIFQLKSIKSEVMDLPKYLFLL